MVSMETITRNGNLEPQRSDTIETVRIIPIQENEYVTMTGGDTLRCCGNRFGNTSY